MKAAGTRSEGPASRCRAAAATEPTRQQAAGDGRRLDVTSDEVAVEPVAVAASQPAHVADELVGDAVAAHVDGVQDVVFESDAAVPAVERRQVARRRRAAAGERLAAVGRTSGVLQEPGRFEVVAALVVLRRQRALHRRVPRLFAVRTDPGRRGEIDDVISASRLTDVDARGSRCILPVRDVTVTGVRHKLVAETLSRRVRKAVDGSTINGDAFAASYYFRVRVSIASDIRRRRRQVARTSFYFRFRRHPILRRTFAVASAVR